MAFQYLPKQKVNQLVRESFRHWDAKHSEDFKKHPGLHHVVELRRDQDKTHPGTVLLKELPHI